MKKIVNISFLLCALTASTISNAYQGVWIQLPQGQPVASKGERKIIPQEARNFGATNYLKNQLFNLSNNQDQAQIIDLPNPEGGYYQFKVWRNSFMSEGLSVKYPNIRTFSGYKIDNKSVTVALDYTEFGFHAMVIDGENTYFIDPYSNENDGFYTVYYKKNYTRPVNQLMSCGFTTELAEAQQALNLTTDGLPPIQYKVNGANLKTYKLALSCTGEYAVAVAGTTPTKPAVLSAMITSVNRVSGVYQREIAVSLQLIPNTDTLIYLDGTADPFSNANGSTMLNQNQNTVTTRIGTANYDIGHVFSTGGGGIASLGCVCKSSVKAQGVTGSANPIGDPFDIDYVAHEMGHQFGGNHTFNANTGSCSGNGSSSAAYEPGSATTIMGYAGICGTANDLQPNSDPYFHAISLSEISNYISLASGGAACPVVTPSGNTPPQVAPFSKSYWIPELTPFEITAPEVTDSDNDTLTYCWEQWNRGDFKSSFSVVRLRGPIFRTFNPTTNNTRIFPQISKVLAGVTNYLGEKLPDTNRYLTFKLTVRDIYNGLGTFNFPDDTIHLDVDTNGAFKVTSQNTPQVYTGASNQLIEWNVANTNQAPVMCDSVEIFMSDDGGLTYPYVVTSGTPNDGSETLLIPNIATTKGRFKVKGKNNVFFNVNMANFTVTFNTAVADLNFSETIEISPIPATNDVLLTNKSNSILDVKIINTVGQVLWSNKLHNNLKLDVSQWSRGVYYLQFTENSGKKSAKPLVLQ